MVTSDLARRSFLKQIAVVAFGMSCSHRVSSTTDYSMNGAKIVPGTPAADGFYMPAEWSEHKLTVMVFPTSQNWPNALLEEARRDWAGVAQAVSEFEPVLMVANQGETQIASRMCGNGVEVIEIPVNDAWSRDTCALFLTNGEGDLRASGFEFNSWGKKFHPYRDDDLFKTRICDHLGVPMYQAPLVLEGGAITVDGEGTLITTEQCLLNKNRNPDSGRLEIESVLKDYLSVRKVIWLAKGLVPDSFTDGHVDGICVFVKPGVVMLHTTDDRADSNHAICEDARRRLQDETDAQGRKLEIIELPLTGKQLAHINFYFTNGGVVVPVAGDPQQDDPPLAVIREVFPDRKIVATGGSAIAEGGGGVHCITQQMPLV